MSTALELRDEGRRSITIKDSCTAVFEVAILFVCGFFLTCIMVLAYQACYEFLFPIRSPFGKVGAGVVGLLATVIAFRKPGVFGLFLGAALGVLFGFVLGNGIDDLFNLSAGDRNYVPKMH